jgi:amino acid adenylation domain-containing protein
MRAQKLLTELRRLNVEIRLEDDRLRYRAPKGTLNEEMRMKLLKCKTEIIALLRERKNRGSVPPLPPLVPDPVHRHLPFPLTEIQFAYLIGRGGILEMGNVACHSYQELDSVKLDLERFELALQRLIERHDTLRLIFLPDGRQQILEQVPPYQIKILDLRGQTTQVVELELEAVRQRMSHQVLPTHQWPLFEIRASVLDDQRTRLHISFDLLIGDVWSFKILFREWFQLYEDLDTPLVPLELSFRDCVLAELDAKNTERYQRDQDYWLSRLPTLPPAPELPLVQKPDALTEPRFVRRRSRLDPETWLRLKARAHRFGLTPSGVLCAAFADVLATWCKSSRFTLNLTLFNRLLSHPQINDIMGDFTTTLLVEVDASPNTFEARAQRLQDQMWSDLEHGLFSGVSLLREFNKVEGGPPKMTMPVVFSSSLISDSKQGKQDEPANPLSSVYGVSQTPQVLLDHQVFENAGALIFNWDTVEEVFPEGLLDDMFDAYCGLLKYLADKEESWSKTPQKLLPAAQLEQRASINATEAPISEEMLQTFFTEQVPQRPDQPAVITPKRTLTYQELFTCANQVGHWLRQREARPNTLVAVVMEKGWEQVVGVLGIHAAGAAYLPIDANLPRERLWYLLEHGQVSLVLTQSWYDDQLEWPEGIERLCVDRADQMGLDENPLETVQGTEDLAYVIYTSGSTGLPKGVVIDHRGAVNTVVDINQRFGVEPEDRVLALSALNFDLSVYDTFGMLAAGGTIVMPEASGNRDPAHWAELILREKVTIWDTVPALMQMLVEYLAGRSETLSESLRLVMMSGDWIPLDLPDRIKSLAEDIEVFSLGGATEASIWSILYPIEKVDPSWTSIPYGRPMANQSFQVLNETFEPCPVWVPGQLYIGGIGLAKGYWRDEEKTRASFITHPRSGERLYRTGDLGRYLPDDNIEFLGREDFQVKIRGHRIELGEIETTLLQHPGVHTAVVAATGELRGNKRLVAYVVPEQTPLSAVSEEESLLKGKPVEADAAPQPEGSLLDPIERLRFKLRQPGLRKDSDRSSVQLIKPEVDEALLASYLNRRSFRKYADTPIPFEQFSHFLSGLFQVEIDGALFPKYRYGSAGSLYPVQTYLYVKPDRVEDVSAGTYYYHPGSHRLLNLSGDARVDRSDFPKNQAIFDESAFAVFLIGQLDAISPMYGKHARDFCMIEAGLMCQLLETSAPANQIGLCQIGGLNFQPFRHLFALEESHIYLHCLLGGRISIHQTNHQNFVEEFVELRPLLDLVDKEVRDQKASASDRLASSSTASVTGDFKPDGGLAEELRVLLGEKLPEYMVPSSFIFLDTLPLSSNGKVDRKMLPEPEDLDLKSTIAHVHPRTEVERILAAIWQEILGAEQVGINDNFFDLGGDSVMAIQIIAKANQTGLQLTPAQIFEHQTVAELATVSGAVRNTQADQGQTTELDKNRRSLNIGVSAPSDANDFNWTQEDLDDIARAVVKSKKGG